MDADNKTAVIHFLSVRDIGQSVIITQVQGDPFFLGMKSIAAACLKARVKAFIAIGHLIEGEILGLIIDILGTVTTIQMRIQHLQEEGFIKRFAAIVDPKMIGRGSIGYVHVNVEKHTEDSLTAFMEAAIQLEEIMECYHIAGAIDFLLRVAIKDMDEYSRVLVKKLGNLPGVRHFESFFVLSEVKCETAFKMK